MSLACLIQKRVDNEYEFSFELEEYELGIQTETEYDYHLANSDKGQHIHFIINNEPYSAHYSKNFSKKMEDQNNVILAFLSRSHHESVKNQDAFILTQISDESIDLNNNTVMVSSLHHLTMYSLKSYFCTFSLKQVEKMIVSIDPVTAIEGCQV